MPRQLTTEPSNEFFCSRSRDGRWIYFDSGRSGRRELWKVPARGGAATQITRSGRAFAQDPGPAIEFYDFTTRRVSRVAVLAIEGELHGRGVAVSPDERSFLYTVWPKPKSDIVLVENFR
jgi:hypothetical protein